MDTNNNWSNSPNPNPSPTQPTMDTVDWRSQLSLDSRKMIIAHLIKKLEKSFSFSEEKDLIGLKQIAIRFECKTFAVSTSRSDYLRRISEKMHAILEGKFKKAAQDKGNNSEPPRAGSQSMQQQNQIHSQGQIIPILTESNQSQVCQQLLPRNVQNNMASSGFQSGMPRPLSNVGGQNISGISQNSMGQGMPSHIYSMQQRPMQGVQQVRPQQQQQMIYSNNTNRPMKVASMLQQGQVPRPDMHSLQQSQQSHGNQMNSQLQSMNLQGSVPKMQSNAGQGNALCSMQHVATRPLHQNPMSASQQANISSLSSQSHNGASVRKQNMNTLQSIVASSTSQQANTSSLSSQSGVNVQQQNMNPLQSNLYELRQQYLKEKQEWQMLQSQSQQRQMQSQQYHQQVKQEFPTQEFQTHHMPQTQQMQQTHQMPQRHQIPHMQQMPQTQQHQQMNNVNDMKIRQGIGVKPGGQSYTHQQFRPGSQFQVASPKHSSPKVDQQSRLTSISKTRSPLQSANSPFVAPSPSTPLAPSPMPLESEKPVPSTSTLSDAANAGHQRGTGIHAVSGPVKISTPGISASPLLADDTHDTGSTPAVPSKSNITEQPPLERLINLVQSMSPRALHSAVSDIAQVVIMADSIAEAPPGNGSRAAIGADLGSMTSFSLIMSWDSKGKKLNSTNSEAATSGEATTGAAASDQRQPWQLQLDFKSRQKVVNRIMDSLKSYLPFSCSQGESDQLRRHSVDFEEKVYNVATSESDYLTRIAVKMLRVEEFMSFFSQLRQLDHDSRQKVVSKIMELVKRYKPIYSRPEGLDELRRISARLEEKMYNIATSLSDYVRKIVLQMLFVEVELAVMHYCSEKKEDHGIGSSQTAVKPVMGNSRTLPRQDQMKYYQFLKE
ncbi:hypothetical protein CCACVL1_27776 [Corchorus capsularis]|uniref:Mediator complex subunit 15 KIX domain-containing protein n=1 Tax=Corchorus capsularis TaxID=210143 RepID=A0A1R3G8Q1_COCAP|nr:hypothetical protein CCACVL1_27776 [Corchorus capsularis]